MNLEEMSEKIPEYKKPNILDYASKPLLRPTIRSSAADLLAEIAEEKGFKVDAPTCDYMGSTDNQALVRQAILDNYGQEEVDNYEPAVNVKPRTKWLQDHCVVKEGETALCFIHSYRDGAQVLVALFHEKQVELRL